ncbi:ABC transporter ATP-binding protein [bacterium]|jgi:spermidine/putrescine transport system ATP-binding protein|nr:ABC transporter ATP-binding protein [bacterium]
MRSIELKNITKSFGGELILHNFSVTIPSGIFFALLGPSGCGKTTILRIIAGLEKQDSGSIFLGKKNITQVPSNERTVNTVFQNYALFPHMNVFDNIAYPLRVKKVDTNTIEQKVLDTLKMVHLEQHIYKPIQFLSGGQQQRVALARAIISEPDVLLLDEPLAALDLGLREKMLIELKELQCKLGTTFVYVTHDQSEALTVAHQMAIMNNNGQIEQIGEPKEIYEFPRSRFVAKFVGTTNILSGKKIGSTIEIEKEGAFSLSISEERKEDGKELSISLRPEKIYITKDKLEGFSNVFVGTVISVVYQGRSTQYVVKLGKSGITVNVFEQNEEHFPKEVIEVGNLVNLYWQKENVVILKNEKI